MWVNHFFLGWKISKKTTLLYKIMLFFVRNSMFTSFCSALGTTISLSCPLQIFRLFDNNQVKTHLQEQPAEAGSSVINTEPAAITPHSWSQTGKPPIKLWWSAGFTHLYFRFTSMLLLNRLHKNKMRLGLRPKTILKSSKSCVCRYLDTYLRMFLTSTLLTWRT